MIQIVSLVLISLGVQGFANAQSLPPLPPGPPEEIADPGMVQKSAEALMKACRPAKERELKGKGLSTSKAGDRAKDICFCIAKDLKRREDLDEMSFMTKYVQDKFDDDHVFSEEQGLWLHEFSKTEKNCGLNPKYRFGQAEPRLPADPAIEKSLRPTDAKPVIRKGEANAPQKTTPARRK